MAISLMAVGCGGEKPAEQGNNAQESQDSWAVIKEKGVMVVGLDDTFRPMGYRDENGDLVGFDIDMGKELEKRLDIKVEWMPTDWGGVTGALNAKKFDAIINGMSITEDRAKVIDFSIPYVNASIGMAVVKDNDDIKTAEDLADRIVGTQSGSSGYEACKKLIEDGLMKEENLRLYNQYPEAFLDMEIGRVDVLVVDVTTAEDFIEKSPDKYKVANDALVDDRYAVGIRKGDTEFKAVLDQAITDMIKDGTLSEISKKWFDGKDITPTIE
jgi:polar amino acid transport system substrate-binding protein